MTLLVSEGVVWIRPPATVAVPRGMGATRLNVVGELKGIFSRTDKNFEIVCQ
jgi:hypothetical protein